MDVHSYNAVMKLKHLETTLSSLLEKVDQEIIQNEVEWLQLKSIAEKQHLSVSSVSVVEESNESVTLQVQSVSKGPNLKIEKDHIDNEGVNSLVLDLNPVDEKCFDGGTEEEFDSD